MLSKLNSEEIEYDIQFFSCLYQLTKERQKIVRKHKSTCTTQKRSLADKSKEKNTGERATEAKFNHCCMICIIIYPGFTIK